ncbi:MAG: hypothetical protein CSA96_03195 [Bacteroidetes bacterium]|nr:MAG: hypothetical protein CSA96_03195 [Bacteroidota bacterium]
MEAERAHIIIAALSFANRLGIKTLLGVMGLDPEITEAADYEQLINLTKNPNSFSHLILDEDLLPSPKHIHFERVMNYCSDIRVLTICNNNADMYSGSFTLLYQESSKRVLEALGDLFTEPSAAPQKNGDNIVLSEREVDVLKQVALGYANKEIAEALYISVNTVISHRKNITDKLGIKTIAGLTVYAIMNNLISPDNVRS